MTRDEALKRARLSPLVWEPWTGSAADYRAALANLLLAARREALEEAASACAYVASDLFYEEERGARACEHAVRALIAEEGADG